MLFSSFNTFGKEFGPFDKYKKRIYSQSGEEGILEFLLNQTNNNLLKNLNIIEFGAWDGIHLSNTFYFVKKYNANAIFIEKDKKKFLDLVKTSKKFPRIIAVSCEVSPNIKSKYSLDSILKKHYKFKSDIDILSIDIDSYDLAIWKSLKKFKPKIVVIEINSEMGQYKKIIHSPKNRRDGNSFASTVEVAQKKGYLLVSHIGNCIFVRKSLIKYLKFNKKFITNPRLLYNDFWLKINPFLYYAEYIINFILKHINRFLQRYNFINKYD